MKRIINYSFFFIVAAFVVIYACKNDTVTNSPSSTTSLYSKLGGYKAIDTVVAVFINNVVADDSVNFFFGGVLSDTTGTRYRSLRQNLVQQICMASGGPCVYMGKDMRTAHGGMNITIGQFSALVNDLVASMTTLGVSQQNRNDLLAILGPLCHDIVANGSGTGCP